MIARQRLEIEQSQCFSQRINQVVRDSDPTRVGDGGSVG